MKSLQNHNQPPGAATVKKRHAVLWFFCAVMAVSAPSTVIATPSAGGAQYTFAFRDADLADVAEAILGRSLGLTYSIDPGLTAKVSFRIDERLTGAQLLQAFETTLALNDIAIVKSGSTLVLEKRSRAKAAAGVHTIDEGRHAIGFQTLAVPFEPRLPLRGRQGA